MVVKFEGVSDPKVAKELKKLDDLIKELNQQVDKATKAILGSETMDMDERRKWAVVVRLSTLAHLGATFFEKEGLPQVLDEVERVYKEVFEGYKPFRRKGEGSDENRMYF